MPVSSMKMGASLSLPTDVVSFCQSPSFSEPVRIFDSGVDLHEPETYGEYKLTYRTGDIISPKVAASEPLALELRDFHNAVR